MSTDLTPPPPFPAEVITTDHDAAIVWAAGVRVSPDALPALKRRVRDLGRAATSLALDGDVSHVNFLAIRPLECFDMPDTTGMSHGDALDAVYDARDATLKTVGYGVYVIRKSAAEVRRTVDRAPIARARIEARRATRIARLLAGPVRMSAGVRERTTARRRGAGRPAARRVRRGGDSGDDDGLADSDGGSRRARRRRACPRARAPPRDLE